MRRKSIEKEEPRPRRFKTNDSTVEKLGELFMYHPPGLLLERDELSGLVPKEMIRQPGNLPG